MTTYFFSLILIVTEQGKSEVSLISKPVCDLKTISYQISNDPNLLYSTQNHHMKTLIIVNQSVSLE